ncbi:MAG: synthase delta subunit [Candidatus Saccharibacteria bacterium]|nr:synthase delta subunit [Candidatus Saccharibacteria bacterium]
MTKISRRKLAQHAASRLASGDKAGDVMRELGAYLIESRRQRELELIVRDIETALLGKGIAIANTTSARTLSETAKRDITDMIKANYSGVSQVLLREQIDPSVIGGVKIELPDRQLDATVRTKLEKLTLS